MKWTGAFLINQLLKTLAVLFKFTHWYTIYTFMAEPGMQSANMLMSSDTAHPVWSPSQYFCADTVYLFTHWWNSHLMQFGVQYLTKGYMPPGEKSDNQPSDKNYDPHWLLNHSCFSVSILPLRWCACMSVYPWEDILCSQRQLTSGSSTEWLKMWKNPKTFLTMGLLQFSVHSWCATWHWWCTASDRLPYKPPATMFSKRKQVKVKNVYSTWWQSWVSMLCKTLIFL